MVQSSLVLTKLDMSDFQWVDVLRHDPMVLLRLPLLVFFETPCGLDELLAFVPRLGLGCNSIAALDFLVTVRGSVFPELTFLESAIRDLRVIRRIGASVECSSLWDGSRCVATEEVKVSFRKRIKSFENDCVFMVSCCRN